MCNPQTHHSLYVTPSSLNVLFCLFPIISNMLHFPPFSSLLSPSFLLHSNLNLYILKLSFLNPSLFILVLFIKLIWSFLSLPPRQLHVMGCVLCAMIHVHAILCLESVNIYVLTMKHDA